MGADKSDYVNDAADVVLGVADTDEGDVILTRTDGTQHREADAVVTFDTLAAPSLARGTVRLAFTMTGFLALCRHVMSEAAYEAMIEAD